MTVGGSRKQVGAAVAAALMALAFIAGPSALAQEPEDIELVDLEQHIRRVATLASESIVTVVSIHRFPAIEPGAGDSPGAASTTSDQAQGQLEATVGSGIVINRNGDIVTTISVVGDGGEYQITTAGGEVWSAELLGYDKNSRLCLLRSGAKNLQPISMGNSEDIGPGTMIIIVGRAFGNLPTVSFGAMNERHPWKGAEGTELISMSAPVYPGNNGGAVLNFRGELIAVVSGTLGGFESEEGESLMRVPPEPPAIATATQDAQMSFAIPVETLAEALPKLRSGVAARSAYFGVRVASTESISEHRGVILSGVVPESPAEGAGLRKGDVIYEYNGVVVTSAEGLIDMVRRSATGNPVEIVYMRDGDLKKTRVVLAEISPYELKLVEKRMTRSP